MKLFDVTRFLSVVALSCLAGGCAQETDLVEQADPASKGKVDPEGMCADWADATCQQLSACCQAPGLFDEVTCQSASSEECLDGLRAELIHANIYVFDAAAAAQCLGQSVTCGQPGPKTQAQEEACHNTLTGYRPPGTGCDSPLECLRPKKGYATCYEGAGYQGVCADVVVSKTGHCSFDKDTFKLTVCPAGKHCDRPPPALGPGDVPSDYYLDFEGDCKALLSAGEQCLILVDQSYELLDCAAGLYCAIDHEQLEASFCAVQRQIGESCVGYPSGECVYGAVCDGNSGTCQPNQSEAAFCFQPPVCGNAYCELGEEAETCPQDCGYCGDDYCAPQEGEDCLEDCGYCGDGVCFWDENPLSCAQDCPGFCGDGVCLGAESLDDCPVDCAVCGDGVCSPYEGCTQDCGECGDGFCAPNEPGWCTADCGEPCASCGVFITVGGTLCEGTSTALYEALITCVCAGACTNVCQDNVCAGEAITSECQNCIIDSALGCGSQFNECANDI